MPLANAGIASVIAAISGIFVSSNRRRLLKRSARKPASVEKRMNGSGKRNVARLLTRICADSLASVPTTNVVSAILNALSLAAPRTLTATNDRKRGEFSRVG